MRYRFLPLLLALLAAGCLRPATSRPEGATALPAVEPRALLERGIESFVGPGRLPAARSLFARAAGLEPRLREAWWWLAWSDVLLGRSERAFGSFLQAAGDYAHPADALALQRAFALLSGRRQAERLRDVLRRAVSAPGTHPLVRARARWLLGRLLRRLGRFDRARQEFARLGFVSEWMVVGPFANDQNSGFDTPYGPEREPLDYRREFAGKLQRVKFRPVERLDYDGSVNLSALLDPDSWSCAYLASHLSSPRAMPAVLRLGVGRAVKVWLNGRLLLSSDDVERAGFDQLAVSAGLRRGWNRLLVKVCQRNGPWLLRLRLTDPRGRPLRLPATNKLQRVASGADRQSRPVPPRQPADVLEQQLKGRGSWLQRLLARWQIEQGFYRRAADRLDRLAATSSGCRPLLALLSHRAQQAAGRDSLALKALDQTTCAATVPGLLLARAAYESSRGRYQRAMRLLRRSRLELDGEGDAARLWTRLLVERGFAVPARQRLERRLQHRPDDDDSWRLLAEVAGTLDLRRLVLRSRRKVLALRPDLPAAYNALVRLARQRGDNGRALQLLDRQARAFPCSLNTRLLRARVLLAVGREPAARKQLERLLRLSPDDWRVYRLLGQLHDRHGRRRQALQAFQRALELKPEASFLRDYVDFLEDRQDPAFERYGLGADQVQQILTRLPPLSAYPEAEAVFLLDDEVTHVFADGSAHHLVHQAYLVRTASARARFNRFAVPSGPSFRLEVAETILPDGSRREATAVRRGAIYFPSLEPGVVIHVAYQYESASLSWMQDHFAMQFNFQGRFPSLRPRWVVVTPPGKQVQILVRGQGIEHRRQSLGAERVDVFTARDMPMLHAEPLAVPERERRAMVLLTTVPSWKELARWQNSLIVDQFESDQAIREQTEKLVADAGSVLAKVEALYGFVARKIRYLNHDVGIFGKKPNKAINVFENRFGDCKDKATLLIAMLRLVGIEAAYAGIRTVDRGPVFWQVPHAQTNHVIAYLPAQPGIEHELFLDTTAEYNHFLHLPERDQGVRALVLEGQGYRLVDTPVLPPSASQLLFTADASLEGDDLVMQVRESWSGWLAAWFRSHLNVEGKRREFMAGLLNVRFPGASLSGDHYRGIDDLGKQAGIDYRLLLPGRARREGKQLRLNLFWFDKLVERMTPRPERHGDVFLPYRAERILRVKLHLPPRVRPLVLPPPVNIDNDLVGFSQSCSEKEGVLECQRRLVIKPRRIPRERYQEFRRLCHLIDQAERVEIVLPDGTQ